MVLTDRIVREEKIKTLIVTHNLRLEKEYGTRLCMFDKGHVVWMWREKGTRRRKRMICRRCSMKYPLNAEIEEL